MGEKKVEKGPFLFAIRVIAHRLEKKEKGPLDGQIIKRQRKGKGTFPGR